MVTEKDCGKEAYVFSFVDGSIEKGILKYMPTINQFFIKIIVDDRFILEYYAPNNTTFTSKKELMYFFKKDLHFDRKTKSKFIYVGLHHKMSLQKLLRKIKDL
jgi:hypothetical protein